MTRFVRGLSIAGACATLTALAWRSWYLCDDAHISFRYVRNLVDGYGLRFNLEDPPIEGFSNLAWVLLAAAVRMVGLDELRVMPGISIVIAVGVLLTAAQFVGRLFPERPWYPVGTAWLLALNSGFSNWATSGLETMQWGATLLVAFLAWLYEVHPVARGALLVLLAASRPEGIAWAAVFVVLGAARHPRSWRAWAVAATIAGLGVVALLLSRYAVFGDWVANTAHAKGGSSMVYYLRGARYFLVAGWETVLPVVGLPVALWHALKWRPNKPIEPLTAVGAVMIGHALLAVVVGGDYMPFGRFLLGSQAFAAVLLVAALGSLGRNIALPALLAVGFLSVLPQFDVSLVPEQVREKLDFRALKGVHATEREVWWAEKTRAIAWGEQGRYLRRALEADEKIPSVAIGAIGYFSHRYVIDSCYLVDRMPEGTVVPAGENSPGHDSCIRKNTHEELFAKNAVSTWGLIRVPEHGRVGQMWTVLLPTGLIRTFYPLNAWDPSKKEDQFFYVDRYRSPWFTPQAGK